MITSGVGNACAPDIAEAWVVWEEDVIESGPLAGKTLGDVAGQFGEALLGAKVVPHRGAFPLLIKLLDCAQWLSLQVHPDDMQAVELEGPGQFGKTEAWHVLDAAPDAKLIGGLKTNTSPAALADPSVMGLLLTMCNMQM